MSIAIKFFCFLLVLGFAGLFVLKKPDGSPWLSFDHLIPTFSVSSVKQAIQDTVPEQIVGGSDDVAVYRWRDDEGNWQYSDSLPENHHAEQIMVSTEVNRDLVPDLKKPTITSSEPKKGKALLIKDSSISPGAVSPDKLSTLIKDAENVQGLVDDRKRQLDEALSNAR